MQIGFFCPNLQKIGNMGQLSRRSDTNPQTRNSAISHISSGNPHIYNHEVWEKEVEEVLLRPGEDRPGKENGDRIGLQKDGMRDVSSAFLIIMRTRLMMKQ